MILFLSGVLFWVGFICGVYVAGYRNTRLQREAERDCLVAIETAKRNAEDHRKRASRHENIITKASQMLNEYRSQIEKI